MIPFLSLWPQQLAVLRSAAQYVLIDGGVGTGKTAACVLRLGRHCIHYPNSRLIAAAQTFQQLKDVFLSEWSVQWGPAGVDGFWTYNQQDHIIRISNGAEIWLRYAEHPRSFERIRGTSISGWYITQAELLRDWRFVERLNDSMRIYGPEWKDGERDRRYLRLMDTNPGNPAHPVYQHYINSGAEQHIDYETEDQSVEYIHVQTTPETSQYSQEIIDQWQRTRRPEEYRRMVEGEWCATEGLVYDDWEMMDHVPESSEVKQFLIGMDPGTARDQQKGEGNLAYTVIAELTTGYGVIGEGAITFRGMGNLIGLLNAVRKKWGGAQKCAGLVLDWGGGSGAVFSPEFQAAGWYVHKPGPGKARYKAVMYGVTRLYESLLIKSLRISPECELVKRDLGMYVYGENGEPDKRAYDSHLLDSLRYGWIRAGFMLGWR